MAIDYQASFVNTDDVAFPNTKSINATGPGAVDGTEFVKIMIDDIWGRFQSILDYASLTPNGSAETPANSQHIEAISKGFGIGPGIGVTYWKNDDPATNGDRVLLLQGQGVLRASYTELDEAVYVGDGNNATVAAAGGGFYHADDAAGVTPNTTGIYLILPETRGYTLRGLDTSATVDPDGASRYLGDSQLDAFQGFTIAFDVNQFDTTLGGGLVTSGNNVGSTVSQESDISDNGSDGTPRTDSETRMINISTNYGVTY